MILAGYFRRAASCMKAFSDLACAALLPSLISSRMMRSTGGGSEGDCAATGTAIAHSNPEVANHKSLVFMITRFYSRKAVRWWPSLLFGGISGSGFHFGDLFVVTHGVQWHINQPLICIQCSEHREWMLSGVILQRKLRFGGEFQNCDALLFKPLFDLCVGEPLAWHDWLGRDCLALTRRHHADDELRLALGLILPSRISGSGHGFLNEIEEHRLGQ